MNLRNAYVRMSIAAALFAAIPFSAVHAVVATPKATVAPKATATPTLTAAEAAVHLTNLKTRGAAEIDRRIASLTGAFDKVSGTKLSAADQAALKAEFTTELAGLATLKTKLAADTTLADARTDVTAIVQDYRVYALMLPKARLLVVNDRLVEAEAQYATLTPMLEERLNRATANHPNLAAATAALADLKVKTAAAKAKTDGVSAKLLALEPTSYNADHTVLVAYRATLASSAADLKAARADVATIAKAFEPLLSEKN